MTTESQINIATKVNITIDNKEHMVPQGITLIQACDYVGIEIPRFCYHDKLSIAGNCRMCLVEMVGGPPKPIASCATNVMEGMVIKTNSEMTKNARKGSMEFLLINHPLDCPICDQAGECDLQDQALFYGRDEGRYREEKRAVPEKEFGPLIKTEMTRCIHCTRCVRFATEIAGIEEIGTIGRGEEMEISTYVDKTLSSELSANIIDLCPVGALTSKPYAFKARSWELTSTDSIDVNDALGSHIRIDSRGKEIMRILPRLNEEINQEWISDKTRFVVDGLKTQRLDKYYLRKDGRLQESTSQIVLAEIISKITKTKNEKIATLAGDLADSESLFIFKKLMQDLSCDNYDARAKNSVMKGEQARSSYLFNSSIERIEEADLCLLIGVNPRLEASVLNARIGQQFRNNKNLTIANIGEASDLTYSYLDLGDNVSILEEILANKHQFAKLLEKAKKPIIILGESCFIRSDSEALLSTINQIVEKFQIIKKNWNGYNVLHNAANRVGALDLKFYPQDKGLNTKNILEQAKSGKLDILFLLNYDSDEVAKIKNNVLKIYIGSNGDISANYADIILPATSYVEKSSLYVNTEGRVQQTKQAIEKLGDAQEEWRFANVIRQALGFSFYQNKAELYQDLIKNNPIFANLYNIEKDDKLFDYKKGKLKNSEKFSPMVTDYYLTNSIARSSQTMAKCSVAKNNKKED